MSSPTITLQSITGVDIELRIAGPGTRSYAFIIDWHIRFILAFAWMAAATFLYTGALFLAQDRIPDRTMMFVIFLPPTIIYFLYHPILEIAMRGRTPGKRMAGVRLVSRSGDIPTVGALLIRNLFRLIDSLPFVYLIGLAMVVFTEQHVRIGDMAAGTLLVLDGSETEKSLHRIPHNSSLPPQTAELVQDVLDRWRSLDDATRKNLAATLIAHIDPSQSTEALQQEKTAALHARLQSLLAGPAAPTNTPTT